MENKEELSPLECLVFASIISADNDEFGLSEDDKQEIISRRQEKPGSWEYILEPIEDDKQRNALIEFFKNHIY